MDVYEKISELSRSIVEKCTEMNFKVATAESCTGVMISAAITSVPGSSAVIELGVCSYSNRIKQKVLGVSEKTLNTFSEYSRECAEEMAQGVLKLTGADFAVSTSGIAGPTGGTDENPVGTVYIGICSNKETFSEKIFIRSTERNVIRAESAKEALSILLDKICKASE